MAIKLPDLPYSMDALAPHISAETLEYHYGKHHRTYVTNLNKLIADTRWQNSTLEEIVTEGDGAIFNNAAQVWNHTFYWNCLSPTGGGEPKGSVATAIAKNFSSFTEFKDIFTQKATTLFGSGWAWLVKNKKDNNLLIVQEGNAGTPLTKNLQPLLTCDVWEHAYYIDYRNSRPEYLKAFWQLVNWEFVAKQLEK